MIPKPPSCIGCPAYESSSSYVPDQYREGAAVLVMGQNPGADEEAQGKPFVGQTGEIMDRKYLRYAGLTRDDVSVGNALRCRWGNTNDLPPLTETRTKEALAHCAKAHFRIPGGVRVIVAQGAYALYSLTGETGIGEWRGYALHYGARSHLFSPWVPASTDLPILATVHLASLLRDPTLTLATASDWGKVPRILARRWPVLAPRFSTAPPVEWPQRFAFDTEYDGWEDEAKLPRLKRWSLAWESLGQPEVRVIEEGSRHVRPRVRLTGVGSGLTKPTVVTQYSPADIRFLKLLSGTEVWSHFTVDDTVWKHAALYSDHPHDLNYLGSIWSTMNRWKHLSEIDPELYAGADAWGTWEVDKALESEFNRDPASRKVYETIDQPAIEFFVEAQYRGLSIDRQRLGEITSLLGAETDDAQARATAIAGWPLNIGSPAQVSHRLFKVEKLSARR